MNEVERHESCQSSNSNSCVDLIGYTRLLATMALRVARRSPATDRILVATCISNASEYTGTESQAQWLIDLNLELREIVMGRIAAMALDFGFHRRNGSHGQSAFADPVVMDTFCQILSANAVASGPASIRHLAAEWIIPSCNSLPNFAVATVVLHLAGEGMRLSAPVGTKDTLQQLSVAAIQGVLVPILADAISDNSTDAYSTKLPQEESALIATVCLRALKTWCDATDLSLPQIKHICSKIEADIIGILSDALYSDSRSVIEALAEFIETTVVVSDEKVISDGRMSQVQYILGVDEVTFRSQFSTQQLKAIESREMKLIVDELISGVGLQRFRFVERQNNGDHDICRNLARIGSTVCCTWLDIPTPDEERQHERGAIALLLKAIAHPSVYICAIALSALTRLISFMPSIVQDLLPMLQRRAITPHYCSNGQQCLDALDLCGVDFFEFQNFRDTILADALVKSWNANREHYMDSCTSAVDEFCSSQSLSIDVSLQLEAALFCIRKIGDDALRTMEEFPHKIHLQRITSSLSHRPLSVLAHPLTRTQLCRFMNQYTRVFGEIDMVYVAGQILLECFQDSALKETKQFETLDMKEIWISSTSAAAFALKQLLVAFPTTFANETSLSALSAVWDISYVAIEFRNATLSIEGRLDLCEGLCHVIAVMPEALSIFSLEALATKPLYRLERIVASVKHLPVNAEIRESLSAIADEIRLLVRLSRSFADACLLETDKEQNGHRHGNIPGAVLDIIGKGWNCITFTSTNWASDKNVAFALSALLTELLPSACTEEHEFSLLNELYMVASSIKLKDCSLIEFEIVSTFVGECIIRYGGFIEKSIIATFAGVQDPTIAWKVSEMMEEMLLVSVAAVKESLGNMWTVPREQKNGQDAFESKPSPEQFRVVKSNECLAVVLNLLRKCLESCPLFLLHLPVSKDVDWETDKLLYRSIDAAVDSLNSNDPEITNSSISFLTALTEHLSSNHETLRSFVVESFDRVRDDCIRKLIVGICGRFAYNALGDVSSLFSRLLHGSASSDIRDALTLSLQQEQFLLGPLAKNVILKTFLRWTDTTRNMNIDARRKLLEDIWRLHLIEDVDALPSSDEVARFLRLYIADEIL